MTPRELGRRLASLVRRGRVMSELDEEIAGHVDDLREALEREGYSSADARRRARIRLGLPLQARDRAIDAIRFVSLEGWIRDIRFGARALRRQPVFTLSAIATFALGIGAATAIFSVAYGVAMRPLPYPEPDRLVRIYEANAANGQPKHDVSVGAFQEWRSAPSLESAALYTTARSRFLAGAPQQPLIALGVSPAFFEVLGVRFLLGQGFKPESQYTRFTTRDIVLSFHAWQRVFGGDRSIVGRRVRFDDDDDPLEVVGVLPDDFAFTQPVDFYQPTVVELPVARILRSWHYDHVIARLRPGATIDQARAELDAIAGRLARDYPATSAGWGVTVESLRGSIVGAFARAAWLLVAAVAVVLLVASVNVGGLLVARAVARERETAVRTALGAGSWQLLRLWIVEAALLGFAGAGVGLGLAWAGVRALKAAAPPGIPRLDAVALDLPTLAATACATALAVVIFTGAPLVSTRRIAAGLRAGTAGGGEPPGRQRARHLLLGAQCAGAAALVVLAVMLTRSFIALARVDLGWQPAGVLSLTVSPPIPKEMRRPWFWFVDWSDRLVERLQATPGIARVAITTQIPLSADSFPTILGRGRGKGAGNEARWPGVGHNVTDGYFDLMGIRAIEGRTFGPADRFGEAQINWTDRPERGVAVVTRSTARALWPGRSAIGQAIWLPDIDNVRWREVVGVVDDIQFHTVGEAPALHVFVPWTQFSTGRPRLLVRASAGPAAAIAQTVRQVVESVEPGTRVEHVAPLDALVERSTAPPRFTSRIVAAFGALALLLAAVGIYGTLSYIVNARTREIGVRIALGASRADVMTDVLKRGLAPALAGGLLGCVAALALARTFSALLFGIAPIDPLSLVTGAVVLFVVALAAAALPARRASRLDPVQALRAE